MTDTHAGNISIIQKTKTNSTSNSEIKQINNIYGIQYIGKHPKDELPRYWIIYTRMTVDQKLQSCHIHDRNTPQLTKIIESFEKQLRRAFKLTEPIRKILETWSKYHDSNLFSSHTTIIEYEGKYYYGTYNYDEGSIRGEELRLIVSCAYYNRRILSAILTIHKNKQPHGGYYTNINYPRFIATLKAAYEEPIF